jgi:hypothetical protein
VPVIPAFLSPKNHKEKNHSPGQPRHKHKSKRVGGMPHMIEYLPSKCKTLNSNLSTIKEKKKKDSISLSGKRRLKITHAI